EKAERLAEIVALHGEPDVLVKFQEAGKHVRPRRIGPVIENHRSSLLAVDPNTVQFGGKCQPTLRTSSTMILANRSGHSIGAVWPMPFRRCRPAVPGTAAACDAGMIASCRPQTT